MFLWVAWCLPDIFRQSHIWSLSLSITEMGETRWDETDETAIPAMIVVDIYPLVMTNIAMENNHV